VVAWFEVCLHFISIRVLCKTTSCVFYSNVFNERIIWSSIGGNSMTLGSFVFIIVDVFNERVVWSSIGGDSLTLGLSLFIIVVHFKLYKIILTTPP
jgi:hypothetical protein